MRLNKVQQDKFREAYGVMYETEDVLFSAMENFNPDSFIIPDVSHPTYRRALVGRLLSGKKRPTDPYRTSQPFHFADIKYFLGSSPIDVVLYGTESMNPFLRGEYDTGKLVKTALKNVGVEIRQLIGSAWDDDSISDPIQHYFTLVNRTLEKRQIEDRTPKNITPGIESVVDQLTVIEGFQTPPLLIVENSVEYGRKHQDMVDFIGRNKLGIDYGTLVFSFVGERAIDPWTVPTKYRKNELRLI